MRRRLAEKVEKFRLSNLGVKRYFLDLDESNGSPSAVPGMGGIAVWLRREIVKPDGLGLNPS